MPHRNYRAYTLYTPLRTLRFVGCAPARGAKGVLMTIGLTLCLSGLREPLAAQETTASQKEEQTAQTTIPHVSFSDAELRTVVLALQQSFGLDVVLEPAKDHPYGLVNVNLSNKTIDFVIRRVARSAGAEVTIEDGVYYIHPKGAPPEMKEMRSEAPPVAIPALEASKIRTKTERVHLQNTSASEVKMILSGLYNDTQLTVMRDAILYGQMNPATQKPFSGPTQPTTLFPTGTNPPNGTTGSAGSPLPPIVPTGGTGSGQSANRATGLFQEEGQNAGLGGNFGGLGGGIGGRGGGGGLGGQQGGQRGQQGGAASSLLPDGIDNIIAYDIDNSLIIRYTDDAALRELKEIIRLLDIAPKQLMIKAEFVQVQQDDVRSFGIDWQISRGSLTSTTGQQATGNFQVNFATGNLVAALRASISEGRGRIVNSPMATTTNNVPVTISIGTNIPVITNSVAFGNNGQGITVPNITTVQVASGLSVFPRINGDNTITMFVVPFVQDILSEVANPAGGTIPITTFQSVPVVRRIGNNETLVIGGLIKKNDRTSTSKVPILGDLPLIGSLFRVRSTTISDSELLVFITPTILPDPAGQSADSPTGASVTPRP